MIDKIDKLCAFELNLNVCFHSELGLFVVVVVHFV